MSAARNAVTAAPASASVTGVPPPSPMVPSPKTTTAATSAPARANHTEPAPEVTPNAYTARHTAKAAPSDAQQPGVGQRVTGAPWISAPATPSARPTSTPSTVRGRRRARTTTLSSVPVGENRADQTSAGAVARLPTASPSTTASASTAARTPSPASSRARRRPARAAREGADPTGRPERSESRGGVLRGVGQLVDQLVEHERASTARSPS